MSSDETVLVTAAAGGTGQFVVQLAKAAGNHVIATCGSPDKAEHLKRLGADRVINYKEEDLKAILKKEYPKVDPAFTYLASCRELSVYCSHPLVRICYTC